MAPPLPLHIFERGVLRGVPDRKAERDLVDKIRKVVDQVERLGRDAAQQISEQVAERVDAPAHGHDETHGLEGLLDMLVHVLA